jgi:uncharacterized protein with von Willebrand factor type A (vWA) domain
MNNVIRTKLVKQVRHWHAAKFDKAAHRRALLDLAGQIAALHDVLDGYGPEQEAVEDELEREEGELAYRVAIASIDRLAQAAQRAAEALPPAQTRPAVRNTVQVLLHMAVLEGHPRPKISDSDPFVQGALDLLEEAGVHVTPDAVRKALSAALRTFDPHLPPPGVDEFLAEIDRAS